NRSLVSGQPCSQSVPKQASLIAAGCCEPSGGRVRVRREVFSSAQQLGDRQRNRHTRPSLTGVSPLFPTGGDRMTTRISIRSVLLVTCGVLLGIAADR